MGIGWTEIIIFAILAIMILSVPIAVITLLLFGVRSRSNSSSNDSAAQIREQQERAKQESIR